MSKESEIIKILKPYFMAFPKSGMDEGALLIYARALSILPVDAINAAMLELLTTSKFWPSVAEIFETAKSIRAYSEESTIPTAADAWGEVIGLVKKYGIYKPWDYSCEEVKRAAELFGKMELCMIEENAVNTARAQFMRMYNEIVQRKEQDRKHQEVLDRLPPLQCKNEALTGKIIQLAEAKSAMEARHENQS